MHEIRIAQALLELVLETLRSSEAGRVTAVKVRIGELSAVDPASLAFCFKALARDGPAAGARVDIAPVPATFRCRSCGHSHGGTPLQAGTCSRCGSREIEIFKGKELELVELQVD